RACKRTSAEPGVAKVRSTERGYPCQPGRQGGDPDHTLSYGVTSAWRPDARTCERSGRMHPVLPNVDTVAVNVTPARMLSGTVSASSAVPPLSTKPTARLQAMRAGSPWSEGWLQASRLASTRMGARMGRVVGGRWVCSQVTC